MKKIKYLLFIFVTFIIGNLNIYAADCSKYGCATCKYKVNNFTLTYTVQSSGKTPVGVSISNDHKNSAYNSVKITDSVSPKVFVSNSTNKIVCPSVLNYTISTNRNGETLYKIFSDTDEKSKAVIKLSGSKNNDLKVTSSNTKTKSCPYIGKMITGTGTGPKVTIETDGKSDISFNFSPNTWKLNTVDKTDITATYFKDYMSKSSCPDVYVSCGGSGNNNYCTVSKSNRLVTPQNPATSTEDKDADATKEAIQKKFNPVKPNIKVNINFSENGCGIIGKDLKNWLQWALDVIRIGGLVLSIVLGISDYLKASFSSNDDGMSKANKNFSTRLFCLGLLFLVPTIIEFLLTLLNIGATSKDPSCGLK